MILLKVIIAFNFLTQLRTLRSSPRPKKLFCKGTQLDSVHFICNGTTQLSYCIWHVFKRKLKKYTENSNHNNKMQWGSISPSCLKKVTFKSFLGNSLRFFPSTILENNIIDETFDIFIRNDILISLMSLLDLTQVKFFSTRPITCILSHFWLVTITRTHTTMGTFILLLHSLMVATIIIF